MAVNDQQKQELENRVGKELAAEVFKLTEQATQKADGSGVAFKAEDEKENTLADLADAQQKAANPGVDDLRADVAAIHASMQKMADAIVALASSKQDDMEDDEEDDDGKEDDMKDKNLPAARQKPAMSDAMKQAIFQDMETFQARQLEDRKFQELDAADQIIAKLSGMR